MEKFKDYGIKVNDSGAGEKTVICMECNKRTLQVNLDTGQWYCENCHTNGILELNNNRRN